jgi:hypothetical protein
MPRAPIVWGAGLSIVLRALPSLILPLLLVASLPSILVRALSPESSPRFLRAFLDLPTLVQGISFLVVYVVSRRAVKNYQRHADRKRLGPDVIEVPRVKLNWPWNLDFIPLALNSRHVGKPHCFYR